MSNTTRASALLAKHREGMTSMLQCARDQSKLLEQAMATQTNGEGALPPPSQYVSRNVQATVRMLEALCALHTGTTTPEQATLLAANGFYTEAANFN